MTAWASNWEQSQLADLLIASFDGAWGDDEGAGGRPTPVLRSTDMRGGTISFDSVAMRGIPETVIAKKKLQNGDVLVNKASGSAHLVGASVIFFAPDSRDYLCSNFTRCLRPDASKVDPEYLHYAMLSKQFRVQAFGAQRTTSGLRNLKIEEFQASSIGYPSLSEQRRISACIRGCMERMEEIERLRHAALTERAYLAESLIEARLAGTDGEDVSMADVCEITSRLIDPREAQFQTLLHVGGANIESKTGRLIELMTAAEENLKSGKFVFDNSVVLYNKIRPYLMKVARPDFSGLCSADMYPLTPKAGKATRDFIYYILMSRRFTDYAIAGSNRAGMPKVNREHLFAYRFKLPSLAVQHQICDHLDSAVKAVYSLGHEMTTAGLESAQLREAILRKAFAGEL